VVNTGPTSQAPPAAPRNPVLAQAVSVQRGLNEATLWASNTVRRNAIGPASICLLPTRPLPKEDVLPPRRHAQNAQTSQYWVPPSR
jgi:hypothetical protein